MPWYLDILIGVAFVIIPAAIGMAFRVMVQLREINTTVNRIVDEVESPELKIGRERLSEHIFEMKAILKRIDKNIDTIMHRSLN